MPHLVILYSGQLERETDMSALCNSLASTLLAAHDDAGKPAFPPGGIRVLAYPAAHSAVADGGAASLAAGGSGDYAFVYLNLRMAAGRTPSTHKRVGDALLMATKAHFQPQFASRHIGVTLQIDEGHEVFDAKHSNLHPLFAPPSA
ncbi:MAG: 5-carboxymethyl-2-hydroxymuconate isomerase [Burkholderiaceae bacterium]|nr:5-carboxymethyl-2-hydroxymuconate isomerase [Burkholderiaceae bacterium]